jgi:hypothetical protein
MPTYEAEMLNSSFSRGAAIERLPWSTLLMRAQIASKISAGANALSPRDLSAFQNMIKSPSHCPLAICNGRQ